MSLHHPPLFQRLQRIDNLKLLFINMHHLVNEFRPHQVMCGVVWCGVVGWGGVGWPFCYDEHMGDLVWYTHIRMCVQARETLKVILQRQTRQKEEMIATLQRLALLCAHHLVHTPPICVHLVRTPPIRVHLVRTPPIRVHLVRTPPIRVHLVRTPPIRVHLVCMCRLYV